jgi:hypothetical protein
MQIKHFAGDAVATNGAASSSAALSVICTGQRRRRRCAAGRLPWLARVHPGARRSPAPTNNDTERGGVRLGPEGQEREAQQGHVPEGARPPRRLYPSCNGNLVAARHLLSEPNLLPRGRGVCRSLPRTDGSTSISHPETKVPAAWLAGILGSTKFVGVDPF